MQQSKKKKKNKKKTSKQVPCTTLARQGCEARQQLAQDETKTKQSEGGASCSPALGFGQVREPNRQRRHRREKNEKRRR